MTTEGIVADNFIDIPFSYNNLDRYVVRKSILRAFNEFMPLLAGRLLDVGCGKMPYRNFVLSESNVAEYIGLDIESAIAYDARVQPDFKWDGVKMPFMDGSFECAIATEVLEHCPEPEVTLSEVNRVLKPEGVFCFTTPFLWNLHEVPHDEYRYTPFSLKRHLENAGFDNVSIRATGGWHASMAQMMGLWVRRAPMSSIQRAMLSRLFKPLMGLLLRKEGQYSIDFKTGPMLTTLYGTARKK